MLTCDVSLVVIVVVASVVVAIERFESSVSWSVAEQENRGTLEPIFSYRSIPSNSDISNKNRKPESV